MGRSLRMPRQAACAVAGRGNRASSCHASCGLPVPSQIRALRVVHRTNRLPNYVHRSDLITVAL